MSEKAKAMREALENAKPKPAEQPSTHPYFDENERNGYAITFPKDNDPIRDFLAQKMIGNIWEERKREAVY